jgi:hypothetical protein
LQQSKFHKEYVSFPSIEPVGMESKMWVVGVCQQKCWAHARCNSFSTSCVEYNSLVSLYIKGHAVCTWIASRIVFFSYPCAPIPGLGTWGLKYTHRQMLHFRGVRVRCIKEIYFTLKYVLHVLGKSVWSLFL